MPTYYVNAASGSNSNSGASAGDAWATLQHAIDTADWSGNDVLTFQLSGTFTLTAELSQHGSWYRARQPVFDGDGSAVIVCPDTARVCWDGGCFKGLEFRRSATSTFPCFNGARYMTFEDCQFTSVAGASGNMLTQQTNTIFLNCDFGTGMYTSGSCVEFHGCRFSEATVGINGVRIDLTRCRFVDRAPGHTEAVFNFSANHSQCSIRHSSFVDTTGTVLSYPGFIHFQNVTCDACHNVFVGYDGTLSLLRSGSHLSGTGNYAFDVPNLGSVTLSELRLDTPIALTATPYADPANNDWTLSSELAAITGSDGLTPGAVQVAGAAASPSGYPRSRVVN